MRAEQVCIVSEGAIENPWFSGQPGRGPRRVCRALLSTLMLVGTEP